MTTHQKKYLNVVYEEIPKEIELGEIARIGQLQNLIKSDFGDAIPVASAFIQLYKSYPDEQITTMADFQAIPEECFIEGGLALDIRTSAPRNSLNKLMKKYLTPVGSVSNTPIESSPSSVDISDIGLELEQQ
ncbi:hypothetical protein MP638_002020, partial [Amoeboaphelidium occidentale]